MGAEYSVCADLEVLDEKAFLLLSRQVFSHCVPHLKAKWDGMKTVDDVAGFILARSEQPENFTVERYDGGAVFHNCFKATYSWLPFMEEWFETVASSLGNNSALLVDGDGHSENYVKDGIAENVPSSGEEAVAFNDGNVYGMMQIISTPADAAALIRTARLNTESREASK